MMPFPHTCAIPWKSLKKMSLVYYNCPAMKEHSSLVAYCEPLLHELLHTVAHRRGFSITVKMIVYLRKRKYFRARALQLRLSARRKVCGGRTGMQVSALHHMHSASK